MKKPPHIVEVFLQPGEFYFGDRNTRIRTVLGSCVSITLWHPRLLIGGMCHYMLPTRANAREDDMKGRYADEVMDLFLQEIRASQTALGDYQVKLFGGGSMFPDSRAEGRPAGIAPPGGHEPARADVASRNTGFARQLAAQYGLKIAAEHLGGTGHRQILFDIWSGYVWVKHSPLIPEPNQKGVA